MLKIDIRCFPSIVCKFLYIWTDCHSAYATTELPMTHEFIFAIILSNISVILFQNVHLNDIWTPYELICKQIHRPRLPHTQSLDLNPP